MLAYGPKAEWLIQGHEQCVYPCGRNSPFDRLRKLNGKVLFFDAPFNSFTFIHYLEDMIKDRLPFQLYHEQPIEGIVYNENGLKHNIKTYVFSTDTVKKRRPFILRDELMKKKILKNKKIGNTNLMLVFTNDTVSCVQEMASLEHYFYVN